MRAKFFLGIDGGATKTISTIANDKGEILGYGSAGSSSHYSVDVEKAKENLCTAIGKAVDSAELSNVMFDVGCFGMSGLDQQSDYDSIFNFVTSLNIAKKYVVVSDAVIAYYTVTLGESKPGIAVIAGTGSVAYGINREGKEARSGGWEWFIDDEGSAFDIARRGLMAAFRGYDGRSANTVLIEMFKKHFKVSTFEDIFEKIYKDTGKLAIASLAPIVTSAAQEGDAVALKILDEAGKELGLAAVAVAKRLNMEEEEIIVSGVGGVFRSGRFIWETFRRTVKARVPKTLFRQPLHDASIGAIILALKQGNVTITKEIANRLRNNWQLRRV